MLSQSFLCCVSYFMLLQPFYVVSVNSYCVSHFMLCQSFYFLSVILYILSHPFYVCQPFYFFLSHFIYFVLFIFYCVSHSIFFLVILYILSHPFCVCQSFHLLWAILFFWQSFHIFCVNCVAFFFKLSDPDHISHFLYMLLCYLIIKSFFIIDCRKYRLLCVLNASDASSPRKIANTLTHLLTRARVQVGQLIYVQARDVLVQWL
jgi:hypothetical protein